MEQVEGSCINTPPEPLPDEVIKRQGEHDYLSTACWHGLHPRCRETCKFCGVNCVCKCHNKKDKMINLDGRHPSVQQVAKYFEYAHLPEHLQLPSKVIAEAVEKILDNVPESAELTAGLRKLLEAKDCFVRAYLPK